MKTISTFISALFILAAITVNGQDKTKKDNKKSSGTNKETSTKQTPKTNMRLVVSFISIGQGIDNSVKEKYDAYVKNHSKKPKYDEAHWGREGEVDYCFTLSELSAKEQEEFVSKTKEMIGKSKLVIISENSPCEHKK